MLEVFGTLLFFLPVQISNVMLALVPSRSDCLLMLRALGLCWKTYLVIKESYANLLCIHWLKEPSPSS